MNNVNGPNFFFYSQTGSKYRKLASLSLVQTGQLELSLLTGEIYFWATRRGSEESLMKRTTPLPAAIGFLELFRVFSFSNLPSDNKSYRINVPILRVMAEEREAI